MNAKPTPILFVAVALSALAAVLASSAQARIPEGNGTQPPSKTVVNEQQAPQGSGTFFVDPEIYAALTAPTVANEGQASQSNGTFFVGPGFYGAMTSATVVNERLARTGSRKLVIDAEICAALGRVRIEIEGCSHAAPLTVKSLRTGTSQAQRKFFEGHLGLNP